jgi:transcription elongation GreA/GreB family factor
MPSKKKIPGSQKSIKQQLLSHCMAYVETHIEIIRSAIAEAQSAVTGETKNTAGDRYETERAMKQRETELFGKRLAESSKLQEQLQHIDISRTYDTVQPGALVTTSIGTFFIAISADELVIDNIEYDLISSESPICQAMLSKKAGEAFSFREKTVTISAVC